MKMFLIFIILIHTNLTSIFCIRFLIKDKIQIAVFLLIVELYNVKENDFFPKNVKISYN